MAGRMGKREHHKNRLAPFVPLLKPTIDSPAWREMSHGAQCLYVALKYECSNTGNKAHLSTRRAAHRLRAGRHKVREWFAELEHYGFIVLLSPGCLGVDGKGKAPHWRLTEKGSTSKRSADGLFEPPSNDFLRWNGTQFDPAPYREKRGHTAWDSNKLKKQNPGSPVRSRVVPPYAPPLVPPYAPGNAESGSPVGAIHEEQGGSPVGAISRITTTRALSHSHGKLWAKPTITDLGERRSKPRRRTNGRRA